MPLVFTEASYTGIPASQFFVLSVMVSGRKMPLITYSVTEQHQKNVKFLPKRLEYSRNSLVYCSHLLVQWFLLWLGWVSLSKECLCFVTPLSFGLLVFL